MLGIGGLFILTQELNMFIYYGFTPRSFVSRLSHLYTFDQFLELEFVT